VVGSLVGAQAIGGGLRNAERRADEEVQA